MAIHEYRAVEYGEHLKEIRSFLFSTRSKVKFIKREVDKLTQELSFLPPHAYQDADRTLLEVNKKLLFYFSEMGLLDIACEELLFEKDQENNDDIKLFTIYFRDGVRQVVAGPDIEKAYKNAKINPNRVASIDWCDEGVTVHRWDTKKKLWVKKIKLTQVP